MSLNAFSQAPNWAWAKQAEGMNDYSYSVTTDILGNVYVTGFFSGSRIVLGSDTLFNSSWFNESMFIVKYDDTGNVLWAKTAIASGSAEATSVTTDALGDVYVTGLFNTPNIIFDMDTLSSTNSTSVFLVKYSANGNVLWAKNAGGNNSQSWGSSVSTDQLANVYVTGRYYSTGNNSTITFGSDTLTNAGGSDIFIAKYDVSGNSIWAKRAGGSGNDVGNSITTDASGVYITGTFDSTIVFGSNTFTSLGVDDIFITKYDFNGNVSWAKNSGGGSRDEATSISSDNYGNIYVAGYYASGDIGFDTAHLFNVGIFPTNDMFIVKYNSNGNLIWAKSEGGVNSENANSVATDNLGSAYIVGSFKSYNFAFGNTTLVSAGSYDAFIVKYDINGNEVWAKSTGGNSDEEGYSLTTDSFGNLYDVGIFGGQTIVFGSNTLTNVNSINNDVELFIAKLNTATGISEAQIENGITISPNPFSSQTTITFSSEQKNSTIKITNLLGEEIKTIHFTGKQLTIEKGEMSNGIYFVSITDGSASSPSNIINRKIVVQ